MQCNIFYRHHFYIEKHHVHCNYKAMYKCIAVALSQEFSQGGPSVRSLRNTRRLVRNAHS